MRDITLLSVALLDSFVISPVHVPSLCKENRDDQKDRQTAGRNPVVTGLQWVLP